MILNFERASHCSSKKTLFQGHPSGKMDCSAERGLDDGGKEPPLGKYIPATGACLPIAVFMENDHGKTLYG